MQKPCTDRRPGKRPDLQPHLGRQIQTRTKSPGPAEHSSQGLHEVRKSAKRARYAVEPPVPVSAKPATRLAIRMKALPDVLGEHRDSVAAQSPLFELATAALESGENGFTFGLPYAQERARANDAHHAHQPALRNASTTRARRWTR